MSHKKVVCSRCNGIVTQCRCAFPNKEVKYVDGCKLCGGTSMPIKQKQSGLELYEQYMRGYYDGCEPGQVKRAAGPGFEEYEGGFDDARRHRAEAFEKAHVRLCLPKQVEVDPWAEPKPPWPDQKAYDGALYDAHQGVVRYGHTFDAWHDITTEKGSSPEHVWDWYIGVNPLVVKEKLENLAKAKELKKAPLIMDDGWLERYRANPGLASYSEAYETIDAAINRIDQLKSELRAALKVRR